MANLPPLPPGFELDKPELPPLPPGFEFESPANPPQVAPISLAEAKKLGLSDQQYEQRAKDYIKGQYGQNDPLAKTGAGIMKSFATEAGPGFVASTAGLPGDIESLGRMGFGWLTGADPGTNRLPTSADIRGKVSNALQPYTGGLYEPRNMAERVAGSVGSFAPLTPMSGGPVRQAANMVRNAVAPGAASELAGEGAKAVGLPEAPARMVAALAAPGIARKIMTPNTIGAEQRAAMEGLRDQGIPVNTDHMIGKNIPTGVPEYTENMLREHFGVNTPNARANPATLTQRFRELGRNYEDIANRNTLTVDPHGSPRHINTELTDYIHRMNDPGALEDAARTQVNRHIDRLRDLAANNHGTIPGSDFHSALSSIKQDQRQAARAGDYQRANAFSELTDILESGMERSMRRAGNEHDADLWNQTNRQYRNGVAIEKAAKPSDALSAQGFLVPDRVVGAMDQVHGNRSLTRNPSQMAQTSRNAVGAGIGKGIDKDPGFWNNLSTEMKLAMVLGGEQFGQQLGSHLGGLGGALGGAVVGTAIPATIGALKGTRSAERYRLNNALPYNYWGSALPPAVVAKALQEGIEPQQRIRITPADIPDNGPALIAR